MLSPEIAHKKYEGITQGHNSTCSLVVIKLDGLIISTFQPEDNQIEESIKLSHRQSKLPNSKFSDQSKSLRTIRETIFFWLFNERSELKLQIPME